MAKLYFLRATVSLNTLRLISKPRSIKPEGWFQHPEEISLLFLACTNPSNSHSLPPCSQVSAVGMVFLSSCAGIQPASSFLLEDLVWHSDTCEPAAASSAPHQWLLQEHFKSHGEDPVCLRLSYPAARHRLDFNCYCSKVVMCLQLIGALLSHEDQAQWTCPHWPVMLHLLGTEKNFETTVLFLFYSITN